MAFRRRSRRKSRRPAAAKPAAPADPTIERQGDVGLEVDSMREDIARMNQVFSFAELGFRN